MNEIENISTEDDCYKPVPREFDPVESLQPATRPVEPINPNNRLIVELPGLSIVEQTRPGREIGVAVRPDGFVITPNHIVIPRPEQSSIQLEQVFRRILEYDQRVRNYYDCMKEREERYRNGEKIYMECNSPGSLDIPELPQFPLRGK